MTSVDTSQFGHLNANGEGGLLHLLILFVTITLKIHLNGDFLEICQMQSGCHVSGNLLKAKSSAGPCRTGETDVNAGQTN